MIILIVPELMFQTQNLIFYIILKSDLEWADHFKINSFKMIHF